MMRAVLWRSLASGAWRLMPIRRLVAVNPSVSKCNSPYIYLSFAVCVGRARVDSVLCYLHTSGLDVGAPVVRASACDSVSSFFHRFLTRSMTKKRLSLILIMESSRFVIEKKKTLLSLSTQRPRARDRRPRRNTATRAPRPLPRRSRRYRPDDICWPTSPPKRI